MLANLTPETRPHARYAKMWLKMYDDFINDPIKNDRLFFNAPAIVIVTADSAVNG